MLENFLYKNMPPPTHIFCIIHHSQLWAYCGFAKRKLFSSLLVFLDVFICIYLCPWERIQSEHISVNTMLSIWITIIQDLLNWWWLLKYFTTVRHSNDHFMETEIRPNLALVAFYLTGEPDTWCLISGRPRKHSREALRKRFGYWKFHRDFYVSEQKSFKA